MTNNILPEMLILLLVSFISLGIVQSQSVNSRPSRPEAQTLKILQVPEKIYVDDKNPVKLECTVTRNPAPVHISFICGDKYLNPELDKPEKTSSYSYTYTYSLENSVVTSMMTNDQLKCVCQVFDLKGQEVRSEPGIVIKQAILEQEWFEHPKSQKVLSHEMAKLKCEHPAGEPTPKVRWEKNSLPLPDNEAKYHYTDLNAVLIIQSFTESDVGNYTCIAYNVMGQVKSKPAKLEISYHQSWMEWQGWGECDNLCGPGLRVRYRRCWNKDLAVVGDGCYGQATETQNCVGACKSANTNTGGSDKGGDESSSSGSNDLADRPSNEWESGNDGKTIILTDTDSRGPSRSTGDQVIMIGVIASVALFIVIALVVVLVLCRKSRSVALHKAYPSGRLASHMSSVYSPNSVVVSKHGEAEIIASMPPCTQSLVSGYNPSTPHQMYFMDSSGYKPMNHIHHNPVGGISPNGGASDHRSTADIMVPMLPLKQTTHKSSNPGEPDHYSSIANDVIPGGEAEYQLEETSAAGAPPGRSTNGGGPTSPVMTKKYERLSTSSYGDDDQPTNNQAEQNNLAARSLVTTKRFYEKQNDILSSVADEKFVIASFTSAGGRLCLPRSGVSLLIPEGAIAPNKVQEVYLAISNEDRERPKLPEGGTILSPIIVCGPSSAQFQRPVVLSFAHSALNPVNDWTISVLNGAVSTRSAWQNLLILGEETANSSAFCQIDEDRCHLLLDSLHNKFCLIGKSKPSKNAVKRLLLAAFAPAALRCQEYNIRIYCVDDTQDALENVIEVEKKCGGVMMDCCKLMHFKDCSQESSQDNRGLHLTLTELSMGWRCKLSNHQQSVPFNHIWCAIQSSLHASFSLEQPNRNMNCLETKIEAFQVNSHDLHCFTIRLSVNDTNTLRRSMMDLTPTGVYDPPGLVFRLPAHVRAKLCQSLDSTIYTQNDWRMLAKKLSFDRYMSYFAAKSSPTSHILDLWEARNRQDSAVRELICAIKSMNGRHDLSSFVEKELGNRNNVI